MLKVVIGGGTLIKRPNGKGHSNYYRDQLSSTEIWVSSTKFSKYLKSKYEITVQEYYNLVVFNDINHKEFCQNNCGREVRFISLSRGYGKYCSLSCGSAVNMKEAHANPDSEVMKGLRSWIDSDRFRTLISNRFSIMNQINWKDENYRLEKSELSRDTINSWESKARSKFKSFLSQGNDDDTCILYVGFTPSYEVKFGVSGSNIDKGRCNRKWRLGLITIHRLVVSTRVKVAKLELMIKLKLGSNSEYVDYSKLSTIISIVKSSKFNELD